MLKRIFRLLLLAVFAFVVFMAAGLLQQGIVDPSQFSGRPGGDEAEVIDEDTIQVSDLSVTVSATGSLLPIRQATLSFETPAVIREVMVEEGQSISEGDVIARQDTFDLEIALQEAQITLSQEQIAFDELISPPREVDLEVAEAAVRAAQAAVAAAADGPDAEDIELAQVRVEQARNTLWQQQLNRDMTLETAPEFRDTDTTDAGAQERQLNSALARLETDIAIAETNLQDLINDTPDPGPLASANAQLVQAQINLDNLVDGPDEIDRRIAEVNLELDRLSVEQATVNLAEAELVAPFNGVVAENNLIVGEQPPRDAIELIDTSGYYVDLTIDETDVAAISVGQAVDLTLDALPEATISGTITRISPTPTRVGQVTTYTARLTLDPTLEPIRAGMSATATVLVSELNNALVIRNRFVRVDRTTGEAFVTTVDEDGEYEEVAVELGVRNETESQILSGLDAGQRVVLLPRETFTDVFGGGPGG